MIGQINDAPAVEFSEVRGRREARGDSPPRDRDIRHVPATVDERRAWILDAVLLHVDVRHESRPRLDDEVDPVVAASDAQVRHLREVVREPVVEHAHDPGAVAITDRPRVAQVEARQIPRDVRDDHFRRIGGCVEKTHADEIVLPIATRKWPQDRMRPIQVQRLRARRWIDVAARALGDAKQQDGLTIDLRGRRVEY